MQQTGKDPFDFIQYVSEDSEDDDDDQLQLYSNKYKRAKRECLSQGYQRAEKSHQQVKPQQRNLTGSGVGNVNKYEFRNQSSNQGLNKLLAQNPAASSLNQSAMQSQVPHHLSQSHQQNPSSNPSRNLLNQSQSQSSAPTTTHDQEVRNQAY